MQSSYNTSEPNRVAGGHKAAMHNPNVSAEAKEHSRQVVEEFQGSGVVHDERTTESSSHSYVGNKDENRVLAGYKATLKNPNVSDEAKQRAEQILGDHDTAGGQHENRVLGGYKAALKNPNVSDKAKQRAEQILEDRDAL